MFMRYTALGGRSMALRGWAPDSTSDVTESYSPTIPENLIERNIFNFT